ncbi:MAG: cation:proton antiporter [Candidatus Aminicenantales bacterium]
MTFLASALIFFLIMLLKSSLLRDFSNPAQSTSIALGFILIFAFLAGKNIHKLRLPQITGFILAGIVCGPYLMKFLSFEEVKNLQLLDGLALSLIALTAGGEMKMSRLKKGMKALLSVVFFQTLIIIAGFVFLGFIDHSFILFLSGKSMFEKLALALLLGVMATATSPSTTIAVITETKAGGKYTNFILSTAVIKDFLIIILFVFSLSFAKYVSLPSKVFELNFLWRLLQEVGGSFLLGVVVGVGIILYLKFIDREMTIFILSVAFFTYQVGHNLGFHPLLICLTAGFVVENFSTQGESLILTIEKSSTPIYVVFFALSGASLNLEALKSSWLIALLIVVWRGWLKFGGTYLGAKIAGEENLIKKYSWMGFISQAGVALGMAVVVEKTFPQWGGEFKALVLAMIAINQVIGPVLLQKFLYRAYEAGRR